MTQFGQAMQQGVTYEQAMKVCRDFLCVADDGSGGKAAPTIAAETGIPYGLVCDILAGKVWPAARAYWMAQFDIRGYAKV